MTKAPTVMSLFDVEDVEMMPKVRDMVVGPVSSADVREFARRYHYTGLGNCANWRWGLWHGAVLHGVIAYNLLNGSVADSVFGVEHRHRVWHMTRLVLSDNSPRNSESRLIGGSLRAIQQKYDVWAVLTYAATEVGHVGFVYQATNALYTGTGGDPVFYTDQTGGRRSTRGTTGDCHWLTVQEAHDKGWSRHRGGVKHRYVYILGSKTQRRQRRNLLRYDVLPYPKATPELSVARAANPPGMATAVRATDPGGTP